MISLVMFVYNDIKLVIAFINLTCNIEPKIPSVGFRLRIDYSVWVIVSWFDHEKRPESLS